MMAVGMVPCSSHPPILQLDHGQACCPLSFARHLTHTLALARLSVGALLMEPLVKCCTNTCGLTKQGHAPSKFFGDATKR